MELLNLVSCSCSPFIDTASQCTGYGYSVMQHLLLLATATTIATILPYSNLQPLLYATAICRPSQKTRHGKHRSSHYCSIMMASESKGNYLTIIPLIALFLLDFLNSNLGPQLCESNTPKWSGEDVPELYSCLDILEPDLSTIDAITDEVILGVDVLAPVVVDIVLC